MKEHIDLEDILVSPHRLPYESYLQIDHYRNGQDFNPEQGLYRLIQGLSFERELSQKLRKSIPLYPRRRAGAPVDPDKVSAIFKELTGKGDKILIAYDEIKHPQKGALIPRGGLITHDALNELEQYNLSCIGLDDPAQKPVPQITILDLVNSYETGGVRRIIQDLTKQNPDARMDPALFKRHVRISFKCEGYLLKFPWRDAERERYRAQLDEYEKECRWRAKSLRVGVYGLFKVLRETSLSYDGRSFASYLEVPDDPLTLPFGAFPLFSTRGTLIYDGLERVPVLQLAQKIRQKKAAKRKKGKGKEEDLDGLDMKEVRTFLDHIESIVLSAGRIAERSIHVGMITHKSISELTLRTAATLDEEFNRLIKGDRLEVGRRCRLLNDLNPLAEVSQKREITLRGPEGVFGEHARWSQRGVHWTHCGRICLTETPESEDIGLNLYLALAARVEKGKLLAPYLIPSNGSDSKQTCWLSPEDEIPGKEGNKPKILAPRDYDRFKRDDEKILARKPGSALDWMNVSDVSHEEKYSGQFLGIGANLIPFVQHDDNNRVMMGAKNMKQAVPLKGPEEPIIQTGREELVARLSGHCIYAMADGTVEEVTSERITLRTMDGNIDSYSLETSRPTLYRALVCHRPRVSVGQEVKSGELLADGSATFNGMLALGVNILVAYMPYEGLNFEDGIVASDRLVIDGILTSLHMTQERFEVLEGEHMKAPDEWQKLEDVKKDKELFDLYFCQGIFVKKGDTVRKGDPLFGKVMWEDGKRVIRYCRAPVSGEVVKVIHQEVDQTADMGSVPHTTARSERNRPKVRFAKACWIQFERDLEVGDKLMGRHGNKGVVAKIVPKDEMPRLEDGTPVDLILNPHGVISRMNLGQILETHWSWVIKKGAGKYDDKSTVTPFETLSEDDLKKAFRELPSTGVDEAGKFQLCRYRKGTKELFPHRVVVGYQYFMKLNHFAEDKMHARETGAYSLTLEQPVKGKKSGGGQRLGEMEVWALESHSCPYIVRELLTTRSDEPSFHTDSLTKQYWQKDFPLEEPIPFTESLYATVMLLRGLCLDLVFVDDKGAEISLLDWKKKRKSNIVKAKIRFADDQCIETWAEGQSVTVSGIPYYERNVWKYPEKGLFDPNIFNPKGGKVDPEAAPTREKMGYIRLAAPVIHPLHFWDIGGQIWDRLQDPSIQQLVKITPRFCVFCLASELCPFSESCTSPCDLSKRCINFNAGDAEELPSRLFHWLMKSISFETLRDRSGRTYLLQDVFYSCKCGEFRGKHESKPEAGVEKKCPKCGSKVTKDITLDAPIELPLLGGARYLQELASQLGLKLKGGAILTHIPVLPLDFRPFKAKVGNSVYRSDLNDFYRSIVTLNQKIESIHKAQSKQTKQTESPKYWRILLCLEKALQRAVNRLMLGDTKSRTQKKKSLAERIEGKEGIFRMHLLGKRVNVSARSVIVPDPSLYPDQIAVPYDILESLLGSKIKAELIRRMKSKAGVGNEENAERLLAKGVTDRKLIESILSPQKGLIKDACVVLNRSPSLHKYSVLSFKPVPSHHKAIGLHPLACQFFNADFDGDTMALYLPLFKESQDEAKKKLLATRNVLSLANGKVLYHFDQEIVLGIYLLTSTAAGREEFNGWFEGVQDELAPIDAPVTKKSLGSLVLQYYLALRAYGGEQGEKLTAEEIDEKLAKLAQQIMQAGFREATRWGLTLSIFDIPRSPVDQEATPKTGEPEQESEGQKCEDAHDRGVQFFGMMYANKPAPEKTAASSLEAWLRAHGTLNEENVAKEEANPLALMFQSGAKGNMKQIIQLGTMRGQLQDINGKDIGPEVRGNFRDGVSPLEYYIGSHAGRRTMCEKKLAVAPAGYLTRLMVEASYPLVIRSEDCGTRQGITVFPLPSLPLDKEKVVSIPPMSKRLFGRTLLASGEIISTEAARGAEQEKTGVQVRSVLTCEAYKEHGYGAVCQKCYGWNLSTMDYPHVGDPIGIWASQSIGERGTQLTMRTFHTGGGGGEAAITGGLSFIRRLFGGSEVSLKTYLVKSSGSQWPEGEKITAWELLCSMQPGESIPVLEVVNDPKEVKTLSLRKIIKKWGIEGIRTVAAFEDYRVFEGAIDERHFEVILKAMLLPDRSKLSSISKVPFAHLSDRSFLSQAAYQRAIGVLADAALKGKEDHLELYKTKIMLGALFCSPKK